MTPKTKLAILVVASLLTGFAARGGEMDKGEVRAILGDVLATEYCGTAVERGLGVETAIHGKSPVMGRGFVCIEEADWGPVLLEMAADELDRCRSATVKTLDELREARKVFNERKPLMKTPEEHSEASAPIVKARRQLTGETRKLHKMLFLMGQMDVERDGVVRMIGRFALECPPEYGLNGDTNGAWIRQTMKDGNAEKCLELGKRYREEKGKGSGEEIDFCCRVAAEVLPAYPSEESYGMVACYVLGAIDGCGDYGQCNRFDEVAAERLRGWVGSLQRRRMAERFPDWRPQRFNPETGAFEPAEPTPEDLARMLTTRAAAELAADEEDLTDLREVYGEWQEEGARSGCPRSDRGGKGEIAACGGGGERVGWGAMKEALP